MLKGARLGWRSLGPVARAAGVGGWAGRVPPPRPPPPCAPLAGTNMLVGGARLDPTNKHDYSEMEAKVAP